MSWAAGINWLFSASASAARKRMLFTQPELLKQQPPMTARDQHLSTAPLSLSRLEEGMSPTASSPHARDVDLLSLYAGR